MPARLAEGERLYRDVVYYYGPAGPWINALGIGLFGRRFVVLEAMGLLAALLLLGSLYRLTARAGSPLSACLATTWAAALCLGSPNGGSFLFPYSFDALFALAGGFFCLAAASGTGSRSSAGFAAGGLALALTAKAEIGAAAAVVLLVASWRSGNAREKRKALGIVATASVLAILVYGVAFAEVPKGELFPEGPLALFSPPPEWRNVYRVISGLADPAWSLRTLATAFFLDLAILAAAGSVSSQALRPARLRAQWVWALLVAGSVVFFSSRVGAPVEDRLPPLLSPLPLLAGLAALFLLRTPLAGERHARFLLFGFSAAVASRVLFGLAYGSVTTPYSILAFPGLAASAAVLVLDPLSQRWKRPAPEVWRRCLAAVFVGLSVVAIVRWKRFQPPDRTLVLSTPSGSLRLPVERGRAVAQALHFLAVRARPGDGLTGFPETGFFNFVTGLRNPLREDQVLPGHLDSIREARVVKRLEQNGPRFVLLANQPTAAFGSVAFGKDYAVGLWKEVERRYRLAASFGDATPDVPIGWPRFFLRVYERRPTSPNGAGEVSTGVWGGSLAP